MEKCFVVANVIVSITARSYLLKVACVNAIMIWYTNKGLTPSEATADENFIKGWKLSMALIKPCMPNRLDNALTLSLPCNL